MVFRGSRRGRLLDCEGNLQLYTDALPGCSRTGQLKGEIDLTEAKL